MIGKPRVNRKADLRQEDGTVVDLPPGWAFNIQCPFHGRFRFDFTPLRRDGRDRLAEQIRDAIWSLRHELANNTLYSYAYFMSAYFWPFLDHLARGGTTIASVRCIDEGIVRQYITWLGLIITQKGRAKGGPMTVGGRKRIYGALKTLLLNRIRYAPTESNPELHFPKNPFPRSNYQVVPREPYSDSELSDVLAAINADLRLVDEQSADALTPLQLITVHVLALAIATGRNRQSLLELRRDCLKPHPLPDREILTTEKRRGGTTHATSYRLAQKEEESIGNASTIPSSVGDYVRALLDYSAPMIADAKTGDCDYLLLYRRTYADAGKVIRLSSHNLHHAMLTFSKRHALHDDQGQPMTISMSRCRPTFATRLYTRTRDIRKVQQALNHASPETTRRHYVTLPDEAERNHAFVGQAYVGWATSAETTQAIRLAADGNIPLQSAKTLLEGGYNTLIARCKNPHRGDGGICGKFLACFRCPQMVVFEDDLHRLYSFYYKLLADQVKMNPNDWVKTYGPIIKTIDCEIAPQFPSRVVTNAKQQAQAAPHPAWSRKVAND